MTSSGPGLRHSQGVLVGIAFSWLLVGTNAVNPLLPLYRTVLGFDALLISLTYVSYVAVLTVFFVVMARPSVVRFASISLLSALILAAGGDALLWTGTDWGVLAGRAISGVAGGLGTGAASALVVVAVGSRGRAITATGNLVGAVIGAAGAQLAVVMIGARALQVVFVGHAVVCVLLAVALMVVLGLRREHNRAALHGAGAGRIGRRDLVAGWAPLTCGAMAWVTLSMAVVLVPSLLGDLSMAVAAASAVVMVLAASATAQVLAGPVARAAPWISGIELIVIGLLLLLASILTQTQWCALVGVAVTGCGIGTAYRTGLVHLCHGATPSRQGALASLYGAVSYGVAAGSTLLAGIFGRLFGLYPTVLGALILLVLAGGLLVRVAPRTGQRPTVERTAQAGGATELRLGGSARPTR